MSCGGCQDRKAERARMTLRARAAMCETCPSADAGAISCTISGLPIAVHVTAKEASCPLGRHPDRRGLVRWLGIVWYGVPAPVRWWLRDRLTGPLPGCGCWKWAKDLTSKEKLIWDSLFRLTFN